MERRMQRRSMERCSIHGTVLNAAGRCFWCDHPDPAAPVADGDIGRLLDLVCTEPIRLQRLSNAELIHECLDSGMCGNPLADELMRRVDPGWMDRYDHDGNPKPDSGLRPFTAASVNPRMAQQPPAREV